MATRKVHLLAAAVWLAALCPSIPSRALWAAGGLVALAAWLVRRPHVFIVAAACCSSIGAGLAWADLAPAETATWHGEAVLQTDPEQTAGGVRVVASLDGESFDLRAWGGAAGHLRGRLMGERVEIDASIRPLNDPPNWMRSRGLVGRGTVNEVRRFDVGQVHTRLANSLRRTIEHGAASMSRAEQSLYSGLVYGDDRTQSDLTADNFKAAGLSHLLAVSGQNVAFVLSIAGPVLRRLPIRRRFAFTLGVLVLFATVTRFEASVVRASVMTAVAAVGALVGSELGSRRILSLAVAGLILAHPLVVHSVAFQLSVAASAGILFWSARIARAIPGPRVFAEAVGVTAAAQLAVAPLLVWLFGGLPVASLPANLVAGPASGPVMMWGLTGGLVAGFVPPRLAELLHLPTRAALWWIDSVAALSAVVPLGELGLLSVAALIVLVAAAVRSAHTPVRVLACLGVAIALTVPGARLVYGGNGHATIDGASAVWSDGRITVVEVDPSTRPSVALEQVRRSGVARIDLLVLRSSSWSQRDIARFFTRRYDVDEIWAPEASLGLSEIVPEPGTAFVVGQRVLRVCWVDTTIELRTKCGS